MGKATVHIFKILCNLQIFSLYFNRAAAEKSTATPPVLHGFLGFLVCN